MEVPSKELLEKVKQEINEDEGRKRQSLNHFREWIAKHPFLKNCRQDDEFLLQFLRTKKFSMDEAFKVFENHFVYRHENPKWFSMNADDEERINEFIDRGIGYTLLKRDSTGSYVAVFNSDCFDLERYSHKDLFHSVFTSLGTNMEHEVNQILGYSCILNFSNTPVKFFTTAPIVDLCNGVKILEKCPGRYKKLVVYGLPSVAVTLFNIAKSCLSEKQKSRLFVCKDNEDLHKIFDKSILPERFGGPEKESDIKEYNFKNFNKTVKGVRRSNEFDIDLMKAEACGKISETVGSFRKLEID